MRKLLIAALGAVALASAGVSGCAALGGSGGLTATLADEKALYALEAANFGVNSAAETAVDTGLVKGGSPQAVRIADTLLRARTAVLAARAAYAAGNATDTATAILNAQVAIGTAWGLIPKKQVGV